MFWILCFKCWFFKFAKDLEWLWSRFGMIVIFKKMNECDHDNALLWMMINCVFDTVVFFLLIQICCSNLFSVVKKVCIFVFTFQWFVCSSVENDFVFQIFRFCILIFQWWLNWIWTRMRKLGQHDNDSLRFRFCKKCYTILMMVAFDYECVNDDRWHDLMTNVLWKHDLNEFLRRCAM